MAILNVMELPEKAAALVPMMRATHVDPDSQFFAVWLTPSLWVTAKSFVSRAPPQKDIAVEVQSFPASSSSSIFFANHLRLIVPSGNNKVFALKLKALSDLIKLQEAARTLFKKK